MATEIRLTHGTTIKTDDNTRSDDVLKKLNNHTSFQPIQDRDGKTFRVNPAHVVYVRDE
jgi:hypothetical protein